MLITDQRISPPFFVFLCSYTTIVRVLYFSVKLAEKMVVDKRKKQKPTGFWGIWLFEISVKSEIIKTPDFVAK